MNKKDQETFNFSEMLLFVNIKSLKETTTEFPMSCHNGGESREQSSRFLRSFEHGECFLLSLF